MTNDQFNEIVRICCKESPDFVKQAKWELLPSQDSNTVDVKTSIIRTAYLNGEMRQVLISGKSSTQDTPECIKSAIEALNEQLLSKLH